MDQYTQYPQGYPQQAPQYPTQQAPGYPPQQAPQWPAYGPGVAPGAAPAAPMTGQQQPYPQQAPQYPTQQAPGYPPQQQGYPQQAPGYPPQQQVWQQPAPVMPQFNLADNQMTAMEYQRSKEEAQRAGRGSDGPPYLKWPAPDGTTKWDSVRVGYESVIRVYIAPPWAPGKTIFRKVASHFWRSTVNPTGTSLPCSGDQCLICRARDAILMGAVSGADAGLMKRAKEYGRVRKQWLYNVFVLDNPQLHFDQRQQMRPVVLAAGSTLHTALGDVVNACEGAMALVHPQQGRPVRLTKRKTGPQQMDIEYGAIPLDRSPLPPSFYPALQALWDLDAVDRVPTEEEMLKALQELGFPHPGHFSAATATGPSAPPVGSSYSPGMSNSPPIQGFAPQGGYPSFPDPAYGQPPPGQAPGYPPGQGFSNPMPPTLNPPPVYSGVAPGGPPAGGYQPQPSQAVQQSSPGYFQNQNPGGAPPGFSSPAPSPHGVPAPNLPGGAPPAYSPHNPVPPMQGAPGAPPWPALDELRNQLRGATGQQPPPGTPGGY